MYIFAIDPGNVQSAYCLMDESLKPLKFDKVDNEELLKMMESGFPFEVHPDTHFAIEMIGHYGTGMPAGKTVFDTCVWIGVFLQSHRRQTGKKGTLIMRREEKMNLCGNMKAKDGNIRQALIDRFGIVGTKKSPGWFYGFKADIWQAYAVGVTYHDIYGGKTNESKSR